MDKFLELFMEAAKPLHKAKILVYALIFLIIIDNLTSYPSLSFTNDKYETIKVLNEIINDKTINDNIRSEAKSQLLKVSNRSSFRDVYSLVFSLKYINIASIKAYMKPPIQQANNTKPGEIIRFIFQWIWFIFCSVCFVFIVFLMVLSDLIKKKGRRRDNVYILAIIFMLMAFFVITSIFFINVTNSSRYNVAAIVIQISTVLFLYTLVGIIQGIVKRYKAYKHDKMIDKILNDNKLR